MKFPLLKSGLILAFLAFAQSATAQVVVDENTEFQNAFYAENIQFYRGPGATLQPQLAGFNLLQIDGYGPGYVYDFCANFDQGNGENWTYDSVTGGMGGLGRQAEIGALFSNALPIFNGMLNAYVDENGGSWDYNPLFNDKYDALQAYAAGMQIALWELIHEDVADLNIDNESPIQGNFRLDLDGTPADPRATAGGENAEAFLAAINSGSWTDQGGITYYFADAPDGEQDRLWMTVPEPSAALLGAFGFLALLRRRRVA